MECPMRSTFSYLSLWQSVSIDSELPKAWRPGFGIFSLPESSCLLFSAVFDRDNSPFFEGFRLDIESSKNAQGGLPGWDRNPELPAALCKRKNNFKQSGKRLPRSPKISRRRAPKLGREDGGTPPLWDFQTVPKESRYQKTRGKRQRTG